jgi:hypothetical protein
MAVAVRRRDRTGCSQLLDSLSDHDCGGLSSTPTCWPTTPRHSLTEGSCGRAKTTRQHKQALAPPGPPPDNTTQSPLTGSMSPHFEPPSRRRMMRTRSSRADSPAYTNS